MIDVGRSCLPCPKVKDGTCNACSAVGCTSLTCQHGKYNSDGNLTNGCDASCMSGCLVCSNATSCSLCQMGHQYSCIPVPEIQSVTVSTFEDGDVLSNNGTFKLSLGGKETAPISLNASAWAIEEALMHSAHHRARSRSPRHFSAVTRRNVSHVVDNVPLSKGRYQHPSA